MQNDNTVFTYAKKGDLAKPRKPRKTRKGSSAELKQWQDWYCEYYVGSWVSFRHSNGSFAAGRVELMKPLPHVKTSLSTIPDFKLRVRFAPLGPIGEEFVDITSVTPFVQHYLDNETEGYKGMTAQERAEMTARILNENGFADSVKDDA